MTVDHDPYAPPAASLERGLDPRLASDAVPPAIVTLLAQTRPWVRLVAVVIFVLSGLFLVALPVMVFSTGDTAGSAPLALAMVPALLLVLVIYLPPGILLWRYAARIRELVDGGGPGALENAIRSQKVFWKYVGILLVALLVIYAVAIVFGAVLLPLMTR